MGRVLQKRKNRSSTSKNVIKSNRTKSGKKKVNVLGNEIIAKNWDKRLTLTQNYRRLGLATRLNVPTGGVEKLPSTLASGDGIADTNPLAIKGKKSATLQPNEARVERDPETGRILRIIRSAEDDDEDEETIEVAGRKRRKMNPLEDPLNELAEPDEAMADVRRSTTDVVSALEKQAAEEEEKVGKRKPRQQSKREEDWLLRLVEKYGDDISAMVRDRKLNPMQQTEGDIRRRLKKLAGNKSV